MTLWPSKPIVEICDFLDNLRKPITESERIPGPYPYYGANGRVGTIDSYIFDEPLILLAEDGGNWLDRTKPIAYAISGKSWVNNHAHVLRPKVGYDFKFVLYSVAYKDVSNLISGSTRGKLTKKAAESIEIPNPPLSEQKRIASVLSRADELRQKRRQADELSGRFLQSLFVKTFGNPAENSKGWEMKRLGDVATFVNGRAFKPSEWTEKGMPIIRIQNLNNPEADYNYFDGDYEGCHLVKQGDLLISWSATLDVFKWDKPPALLNQHIFKVVFDKCEISPDYFAYAVKNELEFMRNKTHGSTMKHITKKPFENTQIMFPPFSLQRKFVVRVSEFETFRKKQEGAGQKVELLFKSLMQQYFGG